MKLRILIGPVAVVLVWTLATATGFIRPLFLPTPWDTLEAMSRLLVDGPLLGDAGVTLYRTALAWGVSVAIGLLVGVAIGVFAALYQAVEVVLDFFRSMPSPALIPLAMLLFGVGDLSRVVVGAFTCSLVNALQAAAAVRSVPAQRVAAARSLGAKGPFMIAHVLVPSVLPGLVTGWRVTLSLALIIIVVSEMFIGTDAGLGMRILDSHLMFRTADMYACILAVGMIGYALNKSVEVLDRRFVHWAGR